MQSVVIEQVAYDPAWDQFLASQPTGHHVQSSPWGELKAKTGWNVTRIIAQDEEQIVGGAQILTRPLPVWGSIGYVSRGPVIVRDRADVTKSVLDSLEQVARTKRLLLLAVEPPTDEPLYADTLKARGFRPSSLYLIPPSTVLVDLQPSENDILARMKSNTRYKICLAARKGITIHEGTEADLPKFFEWMQTTAAENPWSYYDLAYYRKAWRLFGPRGMMRFLLACYEDEPVSGIMVIALGHWAVFKWGASSGAHLSMHPNELLHWHAMLWAKDMGCRYYDLGGITPKVAEALERGEQPPPGKGAGIAQFKLRFGDMATFPQPFDNSYGLRPRRFVRWAIDGAWKLEFLRGMVRRGSTL